MNTYAVVEINGKQYKVQPGQQVVVDHLPNNKEGDEVLFEKVILSAQDGKVQVGMPVVSDIKVIAKVLGHEKGNKIDVFKYKAKSRYRKHIGFRSQLTRLEILPFTMKSVSTSTKKSTIKAVTRKKTITQKK